MAPSLGFKPLLVGIQELRLGMCEGVERESGLERQRAEQSNQGVVVVVVVKKMIRGRHFHPSECDDDGNLVRHYNLLLCTDKFYCP